MSDQGLKHGRGVGERGWWVEQREGRRGGRQREAEVGRWGDDGNCSF